MKNSVLFWRRDICWEARVQHRWTDFLPCLLSFIPPFLFHPSLPFSSLPLPFSVSFPHPTAFGVEENLHSDLGENVRSAVLILPDCLKKNRLRANLSNVTRTSLARHILPQLALHKWLPHPVTHPVGSDILLAFSPPLFVTALGDEAQERGTEENKGRKPTSTGAPSVSE